jgi:hypothetical protein
LIMAQSFARGEGINEERQRVGSTLCDELCDEGVDTRHKKTR